MKPKHPLHFSLLRRRLLHRVWDWISTRSFFYCMLGLFVAQAVWVAFSGAYSMAFDEYFHFGLINLYAQHWLPFIVQPESPASLGAVARDPSYIYHYLFSFPYRLITQLTASQMIHVVTLRLANIALFVGGVLAYRRILAQLGMRARPANLLMLFFLSLPVSVQLAAQLNYDNAQFLLIGLTLYTAIKILRSLRVRQRVDILQAIQLASLLLFACLVKFTFLPFAVTIVLYLAIVVFGMVYGRSKQARTTTFSGLLISSMSRLRSLKGAASVLLLLIITGLCIQRYGVNLVRYQSPAPRCDKVLSASACMAYDPYGRDEGFKKLKYHEAVDMKDKLNYPYRWFEQMIWETYIVVGSRQQNYPVGDPLPVAYYSGHIIAYVALLILLLRSTALWRQKDDNVRLIMVVTGVYTVLLITRNYGDFVRTGIPVAIHARYFVPVFLLIGALIYRSIWTYAVTNAVRYRIVLAAVSVVLLLTFWGGGFTPFIIRSNDTWMWPHAVKANQTLRSTLWPLVVK